jgi:hypothetical protein
MRGTRTQAERDAVTVEMMQAMTRPLVWGLSGGSGSDRP